MSPATVTKRACQGPTVVTIEDAVRDRLRNPFSDPPTTAHAANARAARRVMRELQRKPGVIEQIRAAQSVDEVHALLGEHLTHATDAVRRRWAEAAEARIGELRAGSLAR